MTQYWAALYRVMRRETYRIIQRKSIWVLSLFFPILITLYFGYVFQSALVREIPVAVVDLDHSGVSLTIIRFVESTSSLHIELQANSLAEAEQAMKEGLIDAIFFIPKDLEATIKAGRQATVTMLINSMNLIKSSYIYKDGLAIIKTVSAGALLKKFRGTGMQYEQAMARVRPISIESKVLYNPNYSYSDFLVPGLVMVFLQMIIMVVSVLLLSSEFTHNTFRELADTGNRSILVILLGKSIPHVTLHFLNVLIIFGVLFPIIGITPAVSIMPVLIFSLLFVIVCVWLSLAVSSLFKDQMQATEIALFLNTPAFIFSGLTFPLWSMPGLHSTFAQVIPFTHYLSGFLTLYRKGAPLSYVQDEVTHLGYFFAISAVVAGTALFVRIKKLQKEDIKPAEPIVPDDSASKPAEIGNAPIAPAEERTETPQPVDIAETSIKSVPAENVFEKELESKNSLEPQEEAIAQKAEEAPKPIAEAEAAPIEPTKIQSVSEEQKAASKEQKAASEEQKATSPDEKETPSEAIQKKADNQETADDSEKTGGNADTPVAPSGPEEKR